jgi:hypothetical protein
MICSTTSTVTRSPATTSVVDNHETREVTTYFLSTVTYTTRVTLQCPHCHGGSPVTYTTTSCASPQVTHEPATGNVPTESAEKSLSTSRVTSTGAVGPQTSHAVSYPMGTGYFTNGAHNLTPTPSSAVQFTGGMGRSISRNWAFLCGMFLFLAGMLVL